MTRLLAIAAFLVVCGAVNAQGGPVTEAMKQDCLAAVEQLVDTHDVASEAKTRAVSAVQLHCAFSKEVLERAVLLAAGTDVAGAGCTIVRDNTVTFIPGESCDARNARLAMASARGGSSMASGSASGSTASSVVEQRIYAALARGDLLLPPGDSAWDLLRSPAAAALSPGQRLALQQEFDAQAKTCFGEALNARPERIERARICLEAITLVNPGWQHLQRERRRLAVAIDAVGVTTHGVDAVLAGKVGVEAPAPVATVVPAEPPPSRPADTATWPATRPVPASTTVSDLRTAATAVPVSQPTSMPNPPAPAPQAGFSDVASGPTPSFVSNPAPPRVEQPSSPSQEVPTPARVEPAPARWPESMAAAVPATTAPPAPAVGRVMSSPASAPRKLALVIGNSQYRDEQWGVLPNTVNDVRLVSQALRAIGFAVSENIDLSRDDMITVYSDFEAAANGAEIALVYYAGHAVQVAGENILMPVDAKVGALTAMRDRGLNADSFRDAMSGANLRMLVLDSCRDNPFSSRSGNQFVVTRGGGGGGGLASMRANDGRGRKGSVVLFSTAAGEQALDGEGSNSPFAEAFARHVVVPGVPLQDFIIDVQKQVMQSTQNLQQPYSDSSLLEKNIFLAGEL